MSHATDASAAFARTEPLLTTDELKDRFLPGIPLVAQLPDPVTKKRFVFTDDLLKEYIVSAIADVELDVDVHITPVEVKRRLPFDFNLYQSLGYMKLPHSPVSRVTDLSIRDAQDRVLYTIPPDWIDPGQLQMGQINTIPMQPAYAAGFTPAGASGTGGGNVFLTMLSQYRWVASYWTAIYWTGFREGRIPRVVNDIIGCRCAINVLNRLAATNKVASYSLGLDGASQSVSTQGVQTYAPVIEQLEKDYKRLQGRLKAKFGRKLFSDNV